MNQEEQSVREKIILATIECIEKYGFPALTTRVIAKEAKVNSAAINYYFGTKEKLVDQALQQAMQNALGDTEELLAKGENPYLTLYTMMSFFMAGMIRYPGLMKAFFYEPFVGENFTGPFAKRLGTMLAGLARQFDPLVSEEEKAGLNLSIAQICSTVVFVGLFPKIFQNFLEIDLSTPDKQQEFIEHLFGHYKLGAQFMNTEEQRKLARQMVTFFLQNK